MSQSPTTRKNMMRRHRLRWWRKQRDKLYNVGLRSDGKPRLTDRRPMTRFEFGRHRKKQRRRYYLKRRERLQKLGLNARGKSRIGQGCRTDLNYRRVRPKIKSPFEQIRRELEPKYRTLSVDDAGWFRSGLERPRIADADVP